MDDDAPKDEYYPVRWKIADGIEDIFVLHRAKAIGVIALAGLALILVGFFLLGWDSTRARVDTAVGGSTTATPAANDGSTSSQPDSSTTSSASPSSTSSTTTTSTTTTTSATTTTEAPVSPRAATSEAELAGTEPGQVIELSPTTVRVVGGLPTDELADETVALAETVFSGLTVNDEQVVDESFEAPSVVRFRLSSSDLFEYNRDSLNPTYLPLIDQLAQALLASDSWTVQVTGHTDDTGPAPGNQRLSDGRAASAAQRLVAQGVPQARVTSLGLGEDQPIATNDTEAGRLTNRRVEFIITR